MNRQKLFEGVGHWATVGGAVAPMLGGSFVALGYEDKVPENLESFIEFIPALLAASALGVAAMAVSKIVINYNAGSHK